MDKLCLKEPNEADGGVSRETKLARAQEKQEEGRMQTPAKPSWGGCAQKMAFSDPESPNFDPSHTYSCPHTQLKQDKNLLLEKG